MFDFLFPNHPFGGHTLRLVAQAQQGGADVFDIARAMKNVEPGDRRAAVMSMAPSLCSFTRNSQFSKKQRVRLIFAPDSCVIGMNRARD